MSGGEKFFASALWTLCKVSVPFVVRRKNHRGHKGNFTQRSRRRFYLW